MKTSLIIRCIFCMLIILPATCHAVHSNIDKNITAYSCYDYKKIMLSTDIETELYNYLGDKRFTVTVHKMITSAEYLKEIKNFIRAEYPPPVYTPENVILAMNNQDKIVIAQEVVFNLKNRTAYIASERLYGFPSQQTILNLKSDAIFPNESYVYDIDENWEYGKIANTAIDFMESIKDIYFNPEVRQKYEAEESKYQLNRIRKDYLSRWSGNLTLVWQSSKNNSKIYMDVPSFYSTGQFIYNGWVQCIPNESSNLDFKESRVFFKVDYYNSKIYPFFEVKTNKSGVEEYREITPTEASTLGEWKFIDAILTQLAEKFNLQKTYRQLTGVDIGQPYYP